MVALGSRHVRLRKADVRDAAYPPVPNRLPDDFTGTYAARRPHRVYASQIAVSADFDGDPARSTTRRLQWTKRIIARQPSHQTVVFGVTADPVPYDPIFLHHRQSAVPETDASRINVILAFQFLELQAGMRRIALEETIGTLGFPLSVRGQARK